MCSNIIELDHRKRLVGYTGNYDQYVKTKQEIEVNQMKRYKKEQDDIVKLKHFISTCGTYSNLVKQAKSKQKILDKMYADGLVEKVIEVSRFDFKFAACERLPPPVLSFQNVAFAYSGKKEDYLYRGVTLGVDCDSRVALVGPNGAGKSTLLKLMTNDISPSEGEVKRHLHLVFGKYHQHSADVRNSPPHTQPRPHLIQPNVCGYTHSRPQLHEHMHSLALSPPPPCRPRPTLCSSLTQILDESKTVLDYMIEHYPDKKMEEEEWRKAIGRYGITGVRQKTLIGKLSDGLKTRIIFAMMAIEKPNVLLLDEVTTPTATTPTPRHTHATPGHTPTSVRRYRPVPHALAPAPAAHQPFGHGVH